MVGPDHPAGPVQGVFSNDVSLLVLAQGDQRRGQRGRGEGVEVVGTEDPLLPVVHFPGK